MLRRFAWFALGLGGLLGVTVAGGGFYVQRQLQNSLPQLTGTMALPGLETAVTVDRDQYGIPTITAGSRADAARALGFVHAQDRFFQMDLQRRQAAGELSALVGERAVPADRSARVHRFRHISRQAIAQTTAEYRKILEAYTEGVNAGLGSLGAEPIEYHVLRVAPAPWTTEDTILTVLAMFNTLQGRQPQFEATFGTMRDTLPPAVYDFLTARGSQWDAPVTGGRFIRPPVPDVATFDLRAALPADSSTIPRLTAAREAGGALHPALEGRPWLTVEESAGLGSNNWAVAGAHTATGAALVANDMHLGINVPNIWYRASIVIPDPLAPGRTTRMTGVTLPGLPSLVVGSNGHVAWGFTNTGGDWSDLVIVENDPRAADQYLAPAGARPFDVFDEPIAVAGGDPVPFSVRWTQWGPVIRQDHQGRDIVQRWVAHDAAILAGDITIPERARTVDEALTGAAGLGIPGQNFVAGDTAGRIGWTIAGPIPRRIGFDGSYPTSWADGSRRWDGYLTADQFPRIVDPPGGRLWTANSAVVEGDMLATIGEGGYADGIRALIIRDRLRGIDKATPADMLSVQLDNSALFLDRWRGLLAQVLRGDTLNDARRAEFKRLVDSTWSGRADPDSIAYRLVRAFRSAVSNQVYGAINDLVRQTDPDFDFARANRAEGPLWQLVEERPFHFLPHRFDSWDALLVGAVDEAIADLTSGGIALASQTWGAYNRAVVTHPLGSAIPLVGPWVNMPDDPLPGDIYTPRAHSPRAGPSERMAVSPGREHEGILHMPTGQSGHPLSPHYRDQHRAWVEGTPLPFLPGATVARLTLVPASITN
jgi:penicillin amidase